MQSAVIAAFFHCCSSNRNLMHGQCPDGKDSWCRYKRALSDKRQYLEKSPGLPNSVMKVIKATSLELCDKNLLKQCLHAMAGVHHYKVGGNGGHDTGHHGGGSIFDAAASGLNGIGDAIGGGINDIFG
ncbi:hypothetical protein AVEN_237165-1 [Araneus ventricosus]|uniref:Uncharacterized protein n=1 Tax=Araneus ventricosus TaxID=182803 RepID=A0A4Y2L997_ARAVE|nr:hypothetical protein AVEN_237165-1 [Araneus ventricosus]